MPHIFAPPAVWRAHRVASIHKSSQIQSFSQTYTAAEVFSSPLHLPPPTTSSNFSPGSLISMNKLILIQSTNKSIQPELCQISLRKPFQRALWGHCYFKYNWHDIFTLMIHIETDRFFWCPIPIPKMFYQVNFNMGPDQNMWPRKL